jgi:dephospho-CoA kinase
MNGKPVAEQEDRADYIQTDIPLDDYRVVVLALTGPPAAGKSTAVKMLRDMGVPCKDTGEAIREKAHERYDDPNEDQIWSVAELLRDEHGPAAPTIVAEDWIKAERAHGHEVVCVSSIREEAEAEWLRENVGETLTVRIEANQYARCERYAESKIDTAEQDSVDAERIEELHEECIERERRESPYPPHDVLIQNEDSIGMHDLWRKLENVVEVLDA